MADPDPNDLPKSSTNVNQETDENMEEEEKNKNKKVTDCCKKTVKFLFSHIGLCGMVSAYCVAGGFIFTHLESTNEEQECTKAMETYFPLENSTVNKIWEVAKTYAKHPTIISIEKEEQALTEFQGLLEKFRDDSVDLGYSGNNCTMMGEEGGPAYKWSFSGSLLFSVTVVTTIGYGNIAPKTYWGRLVCIAYATLGIPLMMLCLANIGDVLADVFRFVYSQLCCCGCCKRKSKAEPSQDENNPNQGDESSPEAWRASYQNSQEPGPVVVDDYEDDDEEDEDDRVSVPVTVTIAVIGFYLFIGAMVFSAWESWSPMKAAYFCFITISTIGFGDVVPGSSTLATASDQYKMMFTAVYTLLGLALLSMCFSLIQEEIANKFKWLGEKMGIVEKENDMDDEELDDGIENIDPNPKKKKVPTATLR